MKTIGWAPTIWAATCGRGWCMGGAPPWPWALWLRCCRCLLACLLGPCRAFSEVGSMRGLMRTTEFFQVLPSLLFAMVLVTLFEPTIWTIAFAIGLVSWTNTARLARSEFLRLRQLDYVMAERTIGATNARIIWRVILPNAVAPLIVSATLAVGAAVLFEAGLSFLGLGDPNKMSWGLMIGNNRPYILVNWWAVTLPGVAIFLTVLSISLIGDGLNDALNPRLRDRS